MEIIAQRHHRIDILDAIRGFAILAMVFYHALYDLVYLFNVDIGPLAYLRYLEPPFAGAFILLAGVSSRFSHSNFKRALKVAAVAALVTAGTLLFTPQDAIYFGILHFMAAAILLYALAGRLLEKIPPAAALPLWLALFILTYQMPETYFVGLRGLFGFTLPGALQSVPWLFPFGIPNANFASADYFPLVPWLFLFLAGAVVGKPIRDGRLPERFYTARVPFFAAAGRNTLLIYLLHQPVIYGGMLLFFRVFH